MMIMTLTKTSLGTWSAPVLLSVSRLALLRQNRQYFVLKKHHPTITNIAVKVLGCES
jgi:hypothetical protein